MPGLSVLTQRSSRTANPIRIWARVCAFAISVVVLLIASGCLRRGGPTPTQTEPIAEISRMLGARAESLAKGDIEGYLRPLSPEARAFEDPIARGAPTVPMQDPHFETSGVSSSSKDSLRGVDVSLIYLYEGLPKDNQFRIRFIYDLDRSGDGWRVISSQIEEGTSLPLWASGPVESMRSEHFLALYRPGVSNPQATLIQAEQARSRLAAKLTLPMDSAHLILLARDRDEYDAMSARATPGSAVAQEETTYVVTRNRVATEGRLILVNLERLFGGKNTIETFQHELGHLALAPVTRPFTPGWVGESAAMYLAETRPVAIWRNGSRSGGFEGLSFSGLSGRLSLGQHDAAGSSISAEYAYSAAAAWYLVQTFGPDKFWTFYRSYSEIPASDVFRQMPQGVGPESEASLSSLAASTTDPAFMKVFGFGLADLDARVREWIRSQPA